MANHYHLVARSPDAPNNLPKMLGKLHMLTAREINQLDHTPGRKVWYQFWDTRITFQKSYLARLRYVHENPVHHGLTPVAVNYRWCSAAWFEHNAPRAFLKTVKSFNVDRVKVYDEF